MPTLQQQHCNLWEKHIRRECRDLRRAGRALVRKNHEAPTIPGESIPREPSKPDFSGILTGGRHVCFEAKATLSKTSLPLAAIATHQNTHLNLVDEIGGVAFVYVLDGARRRWVFPWHIVCATPEHRDSLPFGDTHPPVPYDIAPLQKVKGETWLDTLKRLEVIGG